ncbi:MAG: (2Fe-2S)-binding protein [Candidatus Latescibacteria bacterium]|jgi:xanthine dehydrogenase YagT iron-sulfur-binding subunit|nr:(2Fe-2S)-binding protein [Candidatus Latescibacterota bacterium]
MSEDQHLHSDPQETPSTETTDLSLSRRGFLKGMGTGAVTAAVAPAIFVNQAEAKQQSITELPGVTDTRIQLRINGQTHTVDIEARATLASVLRDQLEITGAKVVCDRGECGACTVMVDGRTAYSCTMLALDAQDKEISTIEGLADGDKLHPVQEAFIEKDALMCGFCTPGFVLSTKALLDKNNNPTLEEVKRGVSGNICRCGTYPRVFEAALAAAQKMRNGG